MVSTKNPGGHQDELELVYRLSPSPPNRADSFFHRPQACALLLPRLGTEPSVRVWITRNDRSCQERPLDLRHVVCP